MENVSEFLDTVGRVDFTEQTGLSPQSISRAVAENMMPAGWYPLVREVCASAGVAVPEHLFRWSDKRKVKNSKQPTEGV